jgi:dienelactone hydrolase
MNRYVKYILYAVSTLVLVLVGLCAYLLYVPFYFPKPTGAYAVGMRQYHWIDTSRKEERSSDPAHPYRELMVKAWYPAQKTEIGDVVTPYAPAMVDLERTHAKKIGKKITLLLKGKYRPVYVLYKPEALIAQSEKPFPVIIFSPGNVVPDDLYSAYCTELASNGYVVFSINHPYDCHFVDFPGGRRVWMRTDDYDKLPQTGKEAFLESDTETWVADTLHVLNHVEREARDTASIFYNKLDLEHMGIFGHSFGGTAAVQCCRRDNRLIAGCLIDSGLSGADFAKPFTKPFMFIRAKESMLKTIAKKDPAWKKWFHERVFLEVDKLISNMGHGAYDINFAQAEHMTFSDLAILKHVSICPWMFNYFGTGPVDGFEMTDMVNKFLVSFFDKYLKGVPTEVLEPYRAAGMEKN